MATVVKDRVKVTTTTTGTGAVTLGSAAEGFQSFSVIGDGNETYYVIVGGTEWETGKGTYDETAGTLSRDEVFESSNSNNLVNFSAGEKNVFVAYPASISVDRSTEQTLSNKEIVDPTITLDSSQGTSGQALISQGSGQPPVWGSAGVPQSQVQNTAFAYALIIGG